jgi:hypothetical protein
MATDPYYYYYDHGHTPHEYHVAASPVTLGRWHVLTPLNLVHCVHTSEPAAEACARGNCPTKQGG